MEHFLRIHHVAALSEVSDLLSRLGETPETFTRRILFMSMFNDISCDKKDNERDCLAHAKVVSMCINERECLANAKVVSMCMQRSLVLDSGH